MEARPKWLSSALVRGFGSLAAVALLVGCQTIAVDLSQDSRLDLQGSVQTGQSPIVDSTVRLYATGAGGDGAASTQLLAQGFETDGSGKFSLTGVYNCPSAAAQVYLVATGGHPGSASAAANSSIELMDALGPCGSLGSVSSAMVNEVTTVGSMWPLAAYAKSPTEIGSSSMDAAALDEAVVVINKLASVSQGTAPGPMLAVGEIAPTAKLDTMASILAECVNSSGGVVGDGSPCGQLFLYAGMGQVAAPTDTLTAAMEIAQHPFQDVDELFELYHAPAAFQPTIAAAPADWTLAILTVPAAPSISPGTGTLMLGQPVTIADAVPTAAIYYTTDGSSPSAASTLYAGPITLNSSQTITAVAINSGISSAVSSAVFKVQDAVSVALTPGSVSLQAAQTQAFAASVSGATNTAVSWSLSPAVGSISSAGVYTAPASVAAAQAVMVTATSVADVTKSASASVTLAPPVSVMVTPGAVTLVAGGMQMFSAAVSGATNTAVSWSLSPAVGSISPTGVYAAPASISTAQTVTVTATSVADPSKQASASVTLEPPVSVTLTPGSVTLAAGGTQMFSAAVTGTGNSGVSWALSPAVGSISPTGVYAAPASVSTAQTVTVTATSVADPSKQASASVTLAPPVSVALTPGSVTLGPSGTQIFSATVAGTGNSGVSWSLSPAVGSISPAGVYTAPASIAAAQTVTITAISVADATKKASASVTLAPPIAITVAPGSVVMGPSQSQVFTALVTGSTNTAVSWSLSSVLGSAPSASVHQTAARRTNPAEPRGTGPSSGSISSSGVYTAPATIASPQTVMVTATSAADPAKTASADITLAPPVSVTLTPGSATVSASGTQMFTAMVGGATNTAVTWSLSPAVGSISAAGLYAAPASASAAQTVSVTATSVADPTKMASASVTLAASSSTLVVPPLPSEQAIAADSFVDSVGVQTHLNYLDTPYGSWPQVLSKLEELGVRHIRDAMPSNQPYFSDHQQLAAAGIGCTCGFGAPNSLTAAMVDAYAIQAGDVEALEAPNECDAGTNCGGGGPAGITTAVSSLSVLAAAGKVLGVPVIGPSFTLQSSYAGAGNIASLMTENNLHIYFGGRNPGTAGWGGGDPEGHSYGSFDWWMDQGNLDAPGVPDVVTETGYMSFPAGLTPGEIPETVEESYIPRTLLLSFIKGNKRTFVYELLDEFTTTGYGLLRNDLSEKPAFVAVKNLLALLQDKGSAFAPGSLSYQITGTDSTMQHLLLEKRDGTFWLVLWLEQSSYDATTNQPVSVVAQHATLSLPSTIAVKQIVQFNPSGTPTVSTPASAGSSVPIVLSDQVTIVELTTG